MSRTRFIDHAGQQVVLLEFTGLTGTAAGLAAIEEARTFVHALPKRKEVLLLTDVTGSHYTPEILRGLKDMAAANEPWVARSAVVMGSALHRVAVLAVARFTGREIRGFPNRETALDWLVRGATASSAA